MPLKVNRNGKKLKILITSPSLSESENISGISAIVRDIIKNADDSEFIHFTAGRKDSEKGGIFWFLKQIFLPVRFLWKITREKVDIVHINTAFSTLSIVRDFFLTLTASFTGRPVLLHPNGGRFLLKEIPGSILHWIAGEMLQTADKVLVLGENEKNSLHGRWKNADIEILPNAVAVSEIDSFKKTDGVKTVIFFGRIDKAKGLSEIIEACRILKEQGFPFRFKCYGTGADEEFFKSAMKKNLGEDFEFCGVAAGDAKRKALAEADIFLLPSYFEGLPLSMLEAMAAKCAVVVTDVGSINTVIEDGVNGFLIEPIDTRAVFEKLKILISDDEITKVLQDNARRTIEEKFSIRDYVLKLQEIYREIGG